jgi:acyl carrier protein phosphodiesterase
LNILAHLYLSFGDPQLMIGNFIGDHVRKKHLQNLPEKIALGVSLHWAIDHFTDTHPVVLLSKNRLRPIFRKYSPVIIDMFYDHFLSKNWEQYHNQPLTDFSKEFFEIAHRYSLHIPESAKNMLPFMENFSWLESYGEIDGLSRAFRGMSRRTSFDSGMEKATEHLIRDYELYQLEFKKFFPALELFCQKWLKKDLPH